MWHTTVDERTNSELATIEAAKANKQNFVLQYSNKAVTLLMQLGLLNFLATPLG